MSVIYGNPITLGGGGKAKKLLSSLTEGSLISVLEDGKLVPFYVAKHNYEADLNGEGRTLLVRKDIHSNRQWAANGGKDYSTSDISAWLNADYKDSLSATVKSQIGFTEFPCAVGNGSTTLTAFSRSVFLLSFAELNFTNSGGATEGTPLTIANALKVSYLNGVASTYWLRSPHVNIGAFYIGTGGGLDAGATTASHGVRPCFTLPANMALNTEPYADGSWGLADEDVLLDTTTAKTTPLAPVNYTNGIADLTPAQLHEIAAAISCNPNITNQTSVVYYDSGDVHRKISVGDQQDITINGAARAVNIIGFNHDDLAWGEAYNLPTATGKAGITFQLVDCIEKTTFNGTATNAGGWTSSSMRTGAMPYWLERFESGLVSAIKAVKKLTSAGERSSTISETEDKMFLLSEVEVFGATTYAYAGEGSQYAYYKAGNSKIKTVNGAATPWWLRSPSNTDSNTFCGVHSIASNYKDYANASLGVAFAYCI